MTQLVKCLHGMKDTTVMSAMDSGDVLVSKSLVWLFCGICREGGKHDFVICDDIYK